MKAAAGGVPQSFRGPARLDNMAVMGTLAGPEPPIREERAVRGERWRRMRARCALRHVSSPSRAQAGDGAKP
jgi:hypothetical protein